MKDIHSIFVFNNSTNDALMCTAAPTIEYDALIKAFESICLKQEEIYDIDIHVKDVLKSFGMEMKPVNIQETIPDGADIDIILCDGLPFVWVNTKDKTKAIYVVEVKGNCVDKFMAYNMNTFVTNVKMQSHKIETGLEERMQAEDYHNSDVFERDFAALTEIKEMCLKMADKIQKFQENLTYAEYTAS